MRAGMRAKNPRTPARSRNTSKPNPKAARLE
jgi:hypothetical protein